MSAATAGSVPAGSNTTGGSLRVSTSRAPAVNAKLSKEISGRNGTVLWRSRCSVSSFCDSSTMSVRSPVNRSTLAEKLCDDGSPAREGM